MSVDPEQCRIVGDELNVDWSVVLLDTWCRGIAAELEHVPISVSSHDALRMAGEIALVHLQEDLFYYVRLADSEAAGKAYWKGREKPSPIKKSPIKKSVSLKSTGDSLPQSTAIAMASCMNKYIQIGLVVLIVLFLAYWVYKTSREKFYGSFYWPPFSYDPAWLPVEHDFCEVSPSSCRGIV